MKRILVCAIAIAADIAAIASMCFVGCNQTGSDPQELHWHSDDSNYESTTAVRHERTGNAQHNAEK